MDRETFNCRVATAKPREQIVYHTGDLKYDRIYDPNFQVIDGAARAAWAAAEAGVVSLGQHKVAPHIYAYIATKRHAPYKRITWTGCYDPDPMQHKTPLDKVAA
jgi:hypothetical protein